MDTNDIENLPTVIPHGGTLLNEYRGTLLSERLQQMKKFIIMFVALLSIVGTISGYADKRNIKDLPSYEIAVLIIKKYETLHKRRHWPTIGYGHVVQRGEPFRRGIELTERQVDALLRKDLCKFVALYDHLPKYKILLGVLAYNIGPGAVNKSSVYKKLCRGDTNIYIRSTPAIAIIKANGTGC